MKPSQEIEALEATKEYLAKARYFAAKLQDKSLSLYLIGVYKESKIAAELDLIRALDDIATNGAKYQYFKRLGATFRLFLTEDGYSYLERIDSRAIVIILHSEDLTQLEKLA
jgi:hypothetical protein